MTYLVDSDILIDALRAQGNALTLLGRMAPVGLSISIIPLGELYEGAYRGDSSDEHLQKLRLFLDGYKVLGLSVDTMRVFGNLRAVLRRQGRMISDLDMLIASTALRHDLTLITRNLRHFSRIDGLKIHSDDAV